MKTADAKLREKRDRIRAELQAKRSQIPELRKKRDDAKQAFADMDRPDVTNYTETQEFKDTEEAQANLGRVEDEVAGLREQEAALLSMLGGSDSDHSDRGQGNGNGVLRVWDGHALVAESEGYQAAKDMGVFSSSHQFGTVQIGAIASREDFLAALPAAPAGAITTDQGAIAPDQRGIISPPYRRLSLLDLIPTGTTDSNIVEYVQVTATPQAAAETAELAAKPQEGLTTIDATAPVRTIAGWVKMSRQSLSDVAGLGTLINTLLPYDVRRRLEAQALKGDGVGQNLLGILNTTGIGSVTFVTGSNPADMILRAITVVVLSDQDPNFVALNPVDWQSLLMMKSSGSGEYLYGAPGQVQAPTIWGLAITANRVVTANTPLVGDAMGASILIREGVTVKVSDSDQDDFIKNRVTVLAEARAALPVWRPTAFAVTALS